MAGCIATNVIPLHTENICIYMYTYTYIYIYIFIFVYVYIYIDVTSCFVLQEEEPKTAYSTPIKRTSYIADTVLTG